MTTSRPYGVERTSDQALAELRRCAGSQFDPVVVEAFVAVYREGSGALAGLGAIRLVA
jgi:HD-GYP domain-containing protein (c-di-GMP phosphodiesterase class II)